MDDLYAGWALTGSVDRLTAGVLEPVSEGSAGTYRPYDWAAGSFGSRTVAVPVIPVLVVEGCGSSPRALDRWTTLRIWVEAPEAVRLARGLTRDGAELEAEWRRWLKTEAEEFAREDTRARAHLRVDGTAPGNGTHFVLLP